VFVTNAPDRQPANHPSRRDFIRASSLLVAGGLGIARTAHARGTDELRIGLVGCGARGSSAAIQTLNTTSGPVRLVAMADVFGDRLQGAYRQIRSKHADKVDLPAERRFVGLDACQRLLETDVDLVILATPPGFRPQHFQAAVAAGKHVFLEKPVAVDVPGVRRVLETSAEAQRKNLAVAVGLQRRHEMAYRDTIAQLQSGRIGDLVTLRVYWNSGGVETRPRQSQQSELEYQLRNWYYFTWLSGDHIVEQHVQNLDVANWTLQEFPTEVNAQGGREVRKRQGDEGRDFGQVFDHFFCEYIYPSGARLFSQSRHIRHCWNRVSEHADATRGSADISGGKIYNRAGQMVWRTTAPRAGHQQQWHDLVAALRSGALPNEGEYGAKSTLTAIAGRLAAYSGQSVRWDQLLASNVSLANTDALATLTDPAPVAPDEHGDYPVAVPGLTRPV
jgi:myo-inositol 2-dehydrogenase / D-chiro-inositol 1-dehydrogenase